MHAATHRNKRSRAMLMIVTSLLALSLGRAPRALATSNLTLGIDPASYTCVEPTFEDFEDLPYLTSLDGQTRHGLRYSGHGLQVADREFTDPLFAMRGDRALAPFIGETRVDFVHGPASTFSFLLSMDPWVLDYPGKPVIVEAYAADGTLLDLASYDLPNIGTGTMLEIKITRSSAEIAYVEVHGEERSQMLDAICTDAPSAPEPAPTVRFHQPLDPSTGARVVTNKAKAGRTIPVKVEITLDGVEQDAANVAVPPTLAVSETSCSASASEAVESYADGSANGSGATFRWSAGEPGFWIANLDTQATGMVAGACYRLDVDLDNSRVTIGATQWAVVELTK